MDNIYDYFNLKRLKILNLNMYENDSFQCIGLASNGEGCYFIAFGRIYNDQITSNIQFFDKLNSENISESVKNV